MTLNVYILLDGSGSMAAHWDDDLGAINAYVNKLRMSETNASITVSKFDSGYSNNTPFNNFNTRRVVSTPVSSGPFLRFENCRRNVSVSDYKQLTVNEISPDGGTPLYDATGRLFQMIMNDSPEKAVVIIMTDGEENSSTEVNHKAAKGYVDLLNKKGFEVIFLGADFKNVEKQSMNMGGFMNKTVNTSNAMRRETFVDLAGQTAVYASTGRGFNFSDAYKAKAEKE